MDLLFVSDRLIDSVVPPCLTAVIEQPIIQKKELRSIMQCPKCGSYNCQIITDYESNNRRRLMTGILYGFSFMSACIYGARRIYKKVVS